jgi:hypothetical protein
MRQLDLRRLDDEPPAIALPIRSADELHAQLSQMVAWTDDDLASVRSPVANGSLLNMFLSSFQKLRENVIFSQARMGPVADLGFGVLDTAMVETAAFVLEKG